MELSNMQAGILGASAGLMFVIAGTVWEWLVKSTATNNDLKTNILWFIGFMQVLAGTYLIIVSGTAPELLVQVLR